MKIYFSAPSSNMTLVRDEMKWITDLGHTITHDWTFDSEDGFTKEQLRTLAFKDVEGVKNADCVILRSDPKTSVGCCIELGIAIAESIPVIIIDHGGIVPSHFFVKNIEFIKVVNSLDEALDLCNIITCLINRKFKP